MSAPEFLLPIPSSVVRATDRSAACPLFPSDNGQARNDTRPDPPNDIKPDPPNDIQTDPPSVTALHRLVAGLLLARSYTLLLSGLNRKIFIPATTQTPSRLLEFVPPARRHFLPKFWNEPMNVAHLAMFNDSFHPGLFGVRGFFSLPTSTKAPFTARNLPPFFSGPVPFFLLQSSRFSSLPFFLRAFRPSSRPPRRPRHPQPSRARPSSRLTACRAPAPLRSPVPYPSRPTTRPRSDQPERFALRHSRCDP